MTTAANFSLSERYQREQGQVLLSGIQALVRALMTRAELDRSRGLSSGGFVSGYRGSPLGGLDKELWAQEKALLAQHIHFQPGVNEDLAATAVWGSQQVGLHEGNEVDGVFGLWYGKAPGLDRSCDAIRHANAWGTSPNGGVLLVVGDDPAAKSSSLATQSEYTLQDMMLPILAPASVQEVLDFSVLGWEMSRQSGLWVGLKAIADHMDSAATVEVGLDRYPHIGEPVNDAHIRIEDTAWAQEQRVLQTKLPAALEFARKAGLNRWVTKGLQAKPSRLGIVCAGKAYSDVREALALLGLLDEQAIAAAGIDLLKLGMTWPLDQVLVRQFAAGVERILVVEEKRAFVESQVKDALYGNAQVPVTGKKDASGNPLVPEYGILEPAEIALLLNAELELVSGERLAAIEQTRARMQEVNAPSRQERTPLFCAGCPHNTSTRVPQGSRATAGIGCHYMSQWMGRETDSCTQMGGEGVTWVGEAPFTRETHIFANLGDGTYFHSGILAIRQAVAAKLNITYKILFNEAVAMTGGQPTDGELTVAGLVRQVQAEGAVQVVVVSDAAENHSGLDVEVYDRSELDDVQRRLRQQQGVTVLIYQQSCATELRRKRKRGLVADNKPRLLINQQVCEGCGDCTQKSSCVAVEPVETPFGVKRRINQTGCNKDLSCGEGYCPAFVEVEGELKHPGVGENEVLSRAAELTPPAFDAHPRNILIAGVGGTGIVTVSAVLAAAAKIDGRDVKTLDMTGLAQKGGAVFAHIRVSGCQEQHSIHTPRIPLASADTLIACDLVSAASNEALEMLNSNTLTAVNSHILPTSDFVLSDQHDTHLAKRSARLRRFVNSIKDVDANRHCETLLGDTTQANIFLLGFAYQLGGVPLSLDAIEQAIKVNGFAVERNLLAFHAGRLAAESKLPAARAGEDKNVLQLDDLLEVNRAHLAAYQDEHLANQYDAVMQRVIAAEQAVKPNSEVLARAVARSLGKVLAAKDEYEVARLYTDGQFESQLQAQFEPGATIRYKLAPPVLERFLGRRKIKLGGWMHSVFKVLAAMKGVRNTRLDPFAYSSERKLDLRLRDEYLNWLEPMLSNLSEQNLPIAVALAKLPQDVRGFGHVKAEAYTRMQARRAELLAEFDRSPEPVHVFDPSGMKAA